MKINFTCALNQSSNNTRTAWDDNRFEIVAPSLRVRKKEMKRKRVIVFTLHALKYHNLQKKKKKNLN